MAYRSTSVTSDTPGAVLTGEIETLLTAHTGWEFVEEAASTSETLRLWRCLGTSNGFGSDFYLGLIYLTDESADPTRGVHVICFEEWNATDKLVLRSCLPALSNSPLNADFSGEDPAGLAWDDYHFPHVELPTNTGGFEAFIGLSVDRLVVSLRHPTSDYGLYAGLFDSFVAGGDPFPLCLAGSSGSTTIYRYDVGASRHPNLAATYQYAFSHLLSEWTRTSGAPDKTDLFHDAAVVSSVLLHVYAGDGAEVGYVRGLLKDCFTIQDGSTATRAGDTMTLGGDLYTRLDLYGISVWFSQASV